MIEESEVEVIFQKCEKTEHIHIKRKQGGRGPSDFNDMLPVNKI